MPTAETHSHYGGLMRDGKPAWYVDAFRTLQHMAMKPPRLSPEDDYRERKRRMEVQGWEFPPEPESDYLLIPCKADLGPPELFEPFRPRTRMVRLHRHPYPRMSR